MQIRIHVTFWSNDQYISQIISFCELQHQSTEYVRYEDGVILWKQCLNKFCAEGV